MVEQPLEVSDDGWQLARDDCTQRGMHLVAINTEAEQLYIQMMLTEYGKHIRPEQDPVLYILSDGMC